MNTQRKSAILDIFNSYDFFDRLKRCENGNILLDKMEQLDKKVTEELERSGISGENFEKYKECYDELLVDSMDDVFLAAFKLGLKIGMEAVE